MNDTRRFSGRQITTMVVAVAVAVIAFPVGVWAATGTLVTIADPAHPARKAHVSSTGRLLTTVDGSLAARPLPPAKTWHYASTASGVTDVVLGPISTAVDITSISVSAAADGVSFTVTGLHVPSNASDCSTIDVAEQVYYATKLAVGTPLSVAFPTPLRITPILNHKICLIVVSPGNTVNLSGYLG